MKYKKIILLLIVLICMTGCGRSVTDKAYNISEKVVEYMHDSNVKTKGLSKEEKQIFNDFVISQREENLVINLNKQSLISLQVYTDEEDSYIIYKEGEDYLVKYSDLEFEDVENDSRAILAIDHHPVEIYKSSFPILYDETNIMGKYNYLYDGTHKDDEKVEVYYKSIGNPTGLTFKYYYTDDKITDMYMVYNQVYYHEDSNVEEDNLPSGFVIFLSLVVALIMLVLIVYFFKKSKNN